jgi:pyridoxal 5'-phosphate synthase pdxT subunit
MSFEVDLTVTGVDGPVRAVFIRAPWIEKYGEEVEVLATVDDHPVMVRQANILATSFHPEVAGETRVHEMLLRMEP